MISEMRPLLGSLEKFKLIQCYMSQAFLDLLPFWCPELRELELLPCCARKLGLVLRFDGLKNHKKLLKISLKHAHQLSNNNIEEMLKNNPQLNEIHLGSCRKIDHQVLRSIGYYAMNVETLYIISIPLMRGDAQYFGRMEKLKSLTICNSYSGWLKHIVLIIQHIVAANISLRHLCLKEDVSCRTYRDCNQLVDEILKLAELERITCTRIVGLTESHVYKFCQYLPELRGLAIENSVMPSP